MRSFGALKGPHMTTDFQEKAGRMYLETLRLSAEADAVATTATPLTRKKCQEYAGIAHNATDDAATCLRLCESVYSEPSDLVRLERVLYQVRYCRDMVYLTQARGRLRATRLRDRRQAYLSDMQRFRDTLGETADRVDKGNAYLERKAKGRKGKRAAGNG